MFEHLSEQEASLRVAEQLRTPAAKHFTFFGEPLEGKRDLNEMRLHEQANRSLTCYLSHGQILAAMVLIAEFIDEQSAACFDVGELAHAFYHKGAGQGLCERDHFHDIVLAANQFDILPSLKEGDSSTIAKPETVAQRRL